MFSLLMSGEPESFKCGRISDLTMKPFPTETIKDLFVQLVKFPTINPPGDTKEVVEFLNQWFIEHKIPSEVITHEKDGLTLHNIIARLGMGQKKILLSGHLDVVPPGAEDGWVANDPFSCCEQEGLVYGRGTADMKGGVAGLLATMLILADEEAFLSEYELVFLGSADEEAGMTGAERLLETGVMEGAACLVIPEATNLHVAVAEKGVFWCKVTTSGKAAHGSMPQEGISAIESMYEIIYLLQQSLKEGRSNTFLGKTTLNIGTIHGGTKINIVPDNCVIETDFRLIPEDAVGFEDKLRTLLGQASHEVHLEVTHILPPVQSDPRHPFVVELCKLSGNPDPIGVTYATDGAILVGEPQSPIPFVVFGPGDPSIIHKSNEHIRFDDVQRFSEVLAKALLSSFPTGAN